MSTGELDDIVLDQDQYKQENERVGFGRRFGAYLLDLLFIGIIGAIIASVAGKGLAIWLFGGIMPDFNQVAEQYRELGLDVDIVSIMESIMAYSAGASLATILFFLLEGTFGQSAGKVLLSIVNTDLDGRKSPAGKLWLRSFLKYGSTFLSLVGGFIGGVIGTSVISGLGTLWWWVIFIGFFFAFTDKKQTIHDMIAKTVVSRK